MTKKDDAVPSKLWNAMTEFGKNTDCGQTMNYAAQILQYSFQYTAADENYSNQLGQNLADDVF